MTADVTAKDGGHDRPTDRSSRYLHDADRLAALDETGLMDSPPEPVFDRAVRLATRLLGTPVGLLSLVDGERQFFKAQLGLPEPTASARETPLSHSFCQYVVENDSPLVVRDAREDEQLRDNLAIPDLGVVAYLGVPIHDADGQTLGSFCAIQSDPRDWTEADQETLSDIVAGLETEIALRRQLKRTAAAEEQLRMALRAGRLGTFDFDPRTGTAKWDEELHSIWGLAPGTPDLFLRAIERIHPDDLAMVEAGRRAALDAHGNGRHDVELRISDATSEEEHWVHVVGTVTFENGEAVRMVGTVRDITDRKQAEERSRLLTRELNHRVKNLFAVVTGLISLTARTSDTPAAMGKALRDRVYALASAHALIQPAITGELIETSQVTLQALAAAIIEPHQRDADRVTLAGPTLTLRANAASSLALVLHELATNAAKYGALSVGTGRLDVSWDVDRRTNSGEDASTLNLVWRERGGPSIDTSPTTRGFGSTLVDMTVRGQMRGTIETEWQADGVEYHIALPVARMQA